MIPDTVVDHDSLLHEIFRPAFSFENEQVMQGYSVPEE